MLRIGDFGLFGSKPKQRSIKHIDVIDYRSGFYAVGLRQNVPVYACAQQLLISEERHRFNTISKIVPELIYVTSPRKTAGQANDGYLFKLIVRADHLLLVV